MDNERTQEEIDAEEDRQILENCKEDVVKILKERGMKYQNLDPDELERLAVVYQEACFGVVMDTLGALSDSFKEVFEHKESK